MIPWERPGPDAVSAWPKLRLAGLLAILLAAPLLAASRPPVEGRGGAVASDEKLATEVGLEILRAGGNAADGAVATALALAVVEPEAGNLGGGGFAVIKMGEELAYLDFRETGPAGAHRDLYLDEHGEPLEDASLVGPLAAGVPGTPAGLRALHERFGQLPWRRVVQPAQRLAEQGFPVSRRLAASLEEERELLLRFPETASTWLPDGRVPQPGEMIKLPQLAATLELYAEEGPAALTSGPIAEAVVEVSARHGGILSLDDLATYRPVWRQPLRFEAFGWQVAAADLPSSGGILLAATAELLELLAWAQRPRFGAERAHLLAEAWRRAYADRFQLGDPESTLATSGDLLAAEHLSRRAASVRAKRATPSDQVLPWKAAPLQEAAETTHVSVADAEGGMVALTTTLNGLFGCGLYVPAAGFFLNNEMDDFSTAPGRPNLYGLVQGEANAVAAGRRMLSSQSPTIAWNGSRAVALGARGGSRIPSSTLQVLLNLWVDGDGLQAAVDRPRIHHQWKPDQIFAESDALAPETRAQLEAWGHQVKEFRNVGQVQAVGWRQGGLVEAAAEPRRAGGTAGVVEPLP